jgi:integration host factor subunit beta
MTKAELVEEVSEKTGLPKKQAEIVVNTVFESIVDTLKTGEKIELRGFGSFRIRQRDSRTGRNPKPATRWTSRRSGSPTSSPARSCASCSTSRIDGDPLHSVEVRLHQRGTAGHRLLPL